MSQAATASCTEIAASFKASARQAGTACSSRRSQGRPGWVRRAPAVSDRRAPPQYAEPLQPPHSVARIAPIDRKRQERDYRAAQHPSPSHEFGALSSLSGLFAWPRFAVLTHNAEPFLARTSSAIFSIVSR